MIRLDTYENKKKFVQTALTKGLEAAKKSVRGKVFTICYELDGMVTVGNKTMTRKEFKRWEKKNIFENDMVLEVNVIPDPSEFDEISKHHKAGLSVDEISDKTKVCPESVQLVVKSIDAGKVRN